MVAHGLFYFEEFDRKLPVIYFNTIEIYMFLCWIIVAFRLMF